MPSENALDGFGLNVLAARDELQVAAPGHDEPAGAVEAPHVARRVPAVGVEGAAELRRRERAGEVAGEAARPARPDLTLAVGAELPPGERRAARGEGVARGAGRRSADGRRHLGHAVARGDGQARGDGPVQELGRDGAASDEHGAQRAEVGRPGVARVQPAAELRRHERGVRRTKRRQGIAEGRAAGQADRRAGQHAPHHDAQSADVVEREVEPPAVALAQPQPLGHAARARHVVADGVERRLGRARRARRVDERPRPRQVEGGSRGRAVAGRRELHQADHLETVRRRAVGHQA